jgi:hypothetical protein
MAILVINPCLSLHQHRKKGFISAHICRLIWIYNVCGVKDKRAWDLFYDIFFLNPVMTRHFSHFHPMWPHRRSSSSSFQEWRAAFHSHMGQLFNKTRN